MLSNGKTVTNNTATSPPIFNSSTTYRQGGVDVGTTQYIDAYQRANFWGTVQSASNYHLLLGGPTILAEQTLSPPSNYGKVGSPFGFTAGLVDINWFDAQLPAIMSRLGIQPNTFPIFLTYDVYLTQAKPRTSAAITVRKATSEICRPTRMPRMSITPATSPRMSRRCRMKWANGLTTH